MCADLGTAAAARVFVVEDSPSMRRVYRRVLESTNGLSIVGEASDPYEARPQVLALRPDAVLLDLVLPRMNGLDFLDRLMEYHPLPVVVVSSLANDQCGLALEALRRGAVDAIAKPTDHQSVAEFERRLCSALRAAGSARVFTLEPAAGDETTLPEHPLASGGRSVVAIGASTGGTQAIEHIMTRLPPTCPPVLVAQHLPLEFTPLLAERLDQVCSLRVAHASGSTPLEAGTALIAPGGSDLRVTTRGGVLHAEVADRSTRAKGDLGDEFHCPSVDVLFQSAARAAGAGALGVLLTGMGDDGARGLLALRRSRAATLAQDEASSVVFGMPKAAIELGAAQEVLALDSMAPRIVALSRENVADPAMC